MESANAQTVSWGVIGCGQIAYDKVMPALAAATNAELVALSDPDPARLERARLAAPQAHPYAQIEDLLADPHLQAVYIATPNHLHAAQTIAAAKAGKHILVEKPMAMNAAEGRAMVEATRVAGVKLMVAYMTLFNPAYATAKRAVDAGLLGEVLSVRGRHSYPISPSHISSAAAWRLDRQRGGGPLLDVAVYPIFTLRELTGQTIRTLSATGTTRRLHGETDFDTVLFTFLMADDTPGIIEATFTYSGSLIELEGTRGRLVLSGHFGQKTIGHLDIQLHQPDQRDVAERITHVIEQDQLPHFHNYLGEVEHFGRCLLDGEEPLASGAKAVADLMVTDAVLESLHSGRRVDLPH